MKDAEAAAGGMLMGVRPGGRVGVLRASGGNGGGGCAGGGVCAAPVAYGLVTYEVSDVIDGIASRKADFFALEIPPLSSRVFLPGDLRV